MKLPYRLVSLVAVVSLSGVGAARAQWAVIDVQAVARLAQETQTLQQSLATAQSELQQARQTLQAMSGTRGMERLLAGTVRNYLPPDWDQVAALAAGGGAYGGLAANVRSLVGSNAILPAAAVALLAPDDQRRLLASRTRIATEQTLFQSALSNASSRFAALQALIDAIPAATDQKGILDLQARINAESGMLQNEQTKLLVLAQTLRAEAAAGRQQEREGIAAGQGRFETRFRPAP